MNLEPYIEDIRHQPLTPVMETLRGLLMDTPIGTSAMLAIGWSVLIGLVGYGWALRLYNPDPSRQVPLLSAGHA